MTAAAFSSRSGTGSETLLDFLNLYPHPALILSASQIHAALVTRRQRGHEFTSQSQDPDDSQPMPEPASVAQQHATNADILAHAFETDSSHVDREEPPPSSFLEGGNQKSHDPSRTAEGAVAAMMEQKRRHEVQQEEQRLEGVQERRELRKEDGKQTGEPEWQRRATSAEKAGGSVGRGLAGLLAPVFENVHFRHLMATTDGPSLGFLSLLDRNDIQKLMALLVDAVEPITAGGPRPGVSDKSASEMPLSTRLEIRFPASSIHHVTPFKAQRSQTLSENLQARNAAPDPNVFNYTSSKSGSGTASSSAISRSDLRVAALDVVATLCGQSDSVVLTTVLHFDLPAKVTHPAPPPPPPLDAQVPVRPSLDPLAHTQSYSTVNSTSTVVPHHSSSQASGASTMTATPTQSGDSHTPTISSTKQTEPSAAIPTLEERLYAIDDTAHVSDGTPVISPGDSSLAMPPSLAAVLGPIDFPRAFVEEKKSKRRRRVLLPDVAEVNPATTKVDIEPLSRHDSEDEMSSEEHVPPDLSSYVPQLSGPNDLGFLNALSRTPMGRRIRAFPWITTPLGDITNWTTELRSLVTLVLASPFRSSIWYGPESVLLYNDAYSVVLGNKHPHLLGSRASTIWGEIWDTLGPLSARVMQGETVSRYDDLHLINRHGFIEETYHLWSFIPFWNRDGSEVLGYYNLSVESSDRVIAERRLGVLNSLAILTSQSRNLRDFCEKALHALSLIAYDAPFALLYSCDVPATEPSRRTTTGSDSGTGTKSRRTFESNGAVSATTAVVRFTLQGTLGVPEGHESAPSSLTINVDTSRASNISSRDSDGSYENSDSGALSSSGFTESGPWPFQEACSSKKAVFISDLLGRADGFEERGWPDAPRNALCIPIMSGESDNVQLPSAMLVLGLNPRRPWDKVYATFVHLLTRQLAAGLSAVNIAEQEQKQAEELIALDRAKTNFFSNVSHELRTPLTLILGPLQDVISNNRLQPHDREQLDIVQRHANRLLNMVNNLLDFTRIEGARKEVIYRPVKISAMTADLASLFRSAIERGGIEFIVDCPPDPEDGRKVFLAPDLWEKIVFNLGGNAFKFTVKGHIEISCKYERDHVSVSISDTGCGIPPEELGLIFERFHRIESTSRSRQGTGIGLSLVLELVKALGGTLDVQSTLGEGSIFTVKLPRGSSHLPAAQVLRDAPEEAALPQRAQDSLAIIEEAASWKLDPETYASRKLAADDDVASSAGSNDDDHFLSTADLLDLKSSTVLLVDDNVDLRGFVSNLLNRYFHVVTMPDGEQALEYAIKKPPHIIVTDVMMPKLDGNGLLQALRNNPCTALIPVIFLSAQAGVEARAVALEQGVDDYLVKPFISRELIARVNVHLQLGKMRTELEKRVEERTRALIESETRYRGLADRYSTLSLLSPIGICLYSDEGVQTYANPRWYTISGYPSEGPIADWRESVVPEDLKNVEEVWRNMLSADSTSMERTELRFRNGSYTQYELRPINAGSSQSGFVGSLTDISIVKEVERLRIQSVEERVAAEEENRRQQELYIDISSHELRNPLSGVYQNAETVGHSLTRFTDLLEDLQSGEMPDEDTLQELVEEMQENTESISAIILCAEHQGRIADDLLLVSKLNMSLLTINPQPFNLEVKMKDTIKMVETECQQKQIQLALIVDQSIDTCDARWVVADATRISQVCLNFLTNAVKYTTGLAKASVTLRAEAALTEPSSSPGATRVTKKEKVETFPADFWLSISVEDTGKGLTEEEQKRLFARFSQANPRSDQYGGSGLGLYVCKKLVELHGGHIEVKSLPGKGSIFRCSIPATRPLEIPQTPSAQFLSSAGSSHLGRGNKRSSATVMSTPSTPTHILVVEDNLVNQQILKRQLVMHKIKVTIASDGLEALATLEAAVAGTIDPISAILMDIEMPRMTGHEAIKIIRAREKDGSFPSDYPVIALTGNGREGQITQYLESGFNDVVIKPYRIGSVLQKLEALVGRPLSSGTPASPSKA